MSKDIGDAGEALVASLLRKRGYRVREIGGNYPVIDLEVEGSRPFRVSVKTSASKRHVRMGREASVAQLRNDDFVFAILPSPGGSTINLETGDFDLLILPGDMARTDALHVHRTYLAEPGRNGQARSPTAGIMVKEYSHRPPQVEAWARWKEQKDRWDALPPA